jgi:hypothetical protein
LPRKTSIYEDLGLSKESAMAMLFIVTILLFCLYASVKRDDSLFQYYIGEQVSPLLTQISNILLTYVINPVWHFRKEAIVLPRGA